MGKTTVRQHIHRLIFSLMIALLLEVFVFNVIFFLTHRDEPVPVSEYTWLEDLQEEDGVFTVLEQTADAAILIRDIDRDVHSIKLDLLKHNEPDDEVVLNQSFRLIISARDEGNELFYNLPERVVSGKTEVSQYIQLHLSGNCKELKIRFDEKPTTKFSIKEVTLNVPRPFVFSRLRWILVFLFCLFFAELRSLKEWFLKVASYRKGRITAVGILCVFYMIVFAGVSNMNPFIAETEHENLRQMQYWHLAEALRSGQFHIKRDPSEELLAMQNPYDRFQRKEIEEQIEDATGEEKQIALWDYTYYDEKYYVYFGVVPVLLFYLPHYVLFGYHIQNRTVHLWCALFVIIAMVRLMELIRRKWFKSIEFPFWFAMLAWATGSCGTLLIIKRPDLYSVPIMCALMFTLVGLCFLLDSETCTGHSRWKLICGALCMALVAGCRPQFLLGSFLLVPIFLGGREKRKRFFSSAGNILCIALPYIIIAAGLMYYNYARFGSLFDFGANYNLTTNDMRYRGFRLARVGLAVFEFFFQPVNIKTQFPFINAVAKTSLYQGQTIWEPTYGGVFALNPLLSLSLVPVIPAVRSVMSRARRGVLLFLIFGSFVIAVVDANMAGILERYQADFLWMLVLAVVAVCFSLYERVRTSSKDMQSVFVRCFAAAYIVFLALQTLQLFVTANPEIEKSNPDFFYRLFYRIQFWI